MHYMDYMRKPNDVLSETVTLVYTYFRKGKKNCQTIFSRAGYLADSEALCRCSLAGARKACRFFQAVSCEGWHPEECRLPQLLLRVRPTEVVTESFKPS
eukprot:5952894-Amphidinium_carterae.1